MAQSTRNLPLDKRKRGIYTQYDKNLDVATTSSFVTSVTIDAIAIRESAIVIHNNGAGDLDYQILATAEHEDDVVAPTGTNDDDKGWVILLSDSVATTSAPKVESFSNPWSKVVIQIKHTTLTTNVDIWHRGEN